jgi:hypothetical protein
MIRTALVKKCSAFFFNFCNKKTVVWLEQNIPVCASGHKYTRMRYSIIHQTQQATCQRFSGDKFRL